MKILKFTAENIKKLKTVEITPQGNLVEITGKNGQGKTSILDAIWWCLSGLSNVQEKPIREGERKAMVSLDLGEYVVTRAFTKLDEGEFTSNIKVESKEGAKFPSPQAMLDKLFGTLTFDPLAFSRAEEKVQIQMLKSLVKDFDFEANEAEEKKTYDERTIVNRKAKEASVKHISFKDVPGNKPEQVDVKALTERMANASKKNVDLAAEKVRREEIERKIKAIKETAQERLDKAQAALDKAQKDFEETKETGKKLEGQWVELENELKGLNALEAMEDVDQLKKELEMAQVKNETYEKWLKKEEAKKEVEAHEQNSEALTKRIEELKKQRLDAIKNAGLPVSGIGFEGDVVTLNGLPLKQGSDAEQLRTSIAIAMASNPTLKVIRVRDGSLLDEDGMKLLAEMAEKNDYQIWIERVDGSGKVGFVIEDGQLKS